MAEPVSPEVTPAEAYDPPNSESARRANDLGDVIGKGAEKAKSGQDDISAKLLEMMGTR